MKILNLAQGSKEWHAHRATARNSSDAPALMDASPYVTRAELIRQRATGITPEVDGKTQAIFNRGHEVEPLLRALAEKMIGEELYPVVATSDDGYLSASLDGATMDERVIFEAKQTNKDKMEDVVNGRLPCADRWQVVQQMAVCESAEKCLYMVGDGTEDGTRFLVIRRGEIEADIAHLRAAWAQFDTDLAAYVPEPIKAAPVAAPVEGFGALSLRVEGRVLASNLDAFKAGADAFIARLPKPADLKTDQDFVNADAAVKACAEAESRIKAAKDAAISQMADVDAVLRAADTITETIRAARLALDKVVKAEKENRKIEIVRLARWAAQSFADEINRHLSVQIVLPASLNADITNAVKGLKSLKSIEDAASQVVANAKIAASAEAERHRANLAVLEKAGRPELFADRDALVRSKQPEDLRNLAAARVAAADKAEADRLEAERERIRKEEEAKAKAKIDAERQAEQDRIKKEEEAKLAVEQTPVPVEVKTADPIPPAAPAVTPATVAANTGAAPRVAVSAGTETMKLGDINARIAPISITADGLLTLGFAPVGAGGTAKLYRESDFEPMCRAMAAALCSAIEFYQQIERPQQKAAA